MLNQPVYQVYDLFRKEIDPSRCSIYILALVFLKYLASLDEDVGVPRAEGLGGLFQSKDDSELDIRINEILQSVEAGSPGLDGVLSAIDFTNNMDLGDKLQRVTLLRRAIELLNQLPILGDSGLRPGARELWVQFLRRTKSLNSRRGSAVTPPVLADLIARVGSPRKGDAVCDPFAGSGSLLVEAARLATDCTFFGQEVNYHEWLVCRMNLFVHGIQDARVELGDTLRAPGLQDAGGLMKFDLILSNPPLGLKNWDGDSMQDQWGRFVWGAPPSTSGDWAILSHMLSTLSDCGRAVVVVPAGVLFRGGSEGRIRQNVVEANFVESIIYLPPNTLDVTTIPLALLELSRAKVDKTVLFVDGRGGSDRDQGGARLDQRVSDEILAARSGADVNASLVRRVTVAEIAERDFDLSAQRYFSQVSAAEPVDSASLWEELEHIESEMVNTLGALRAAIKTLE